MCVWECVHKVYRCVLESMSECVILLSDSMNINAGTVLNIIYSFILYTQVRKKSFTGSQSSECLICDMGDS